MQRTLLQVVQAYLDTTSGFYVQSIFDTDESQQVAQIAERVYYQMVQEYPNLLFTMKQRTLDSVADADKPNFLAIPSDVQKIESSRIYYNASKVDGQLDYKSVTYLTPQEFMSHLAGKSSKSITVVEGFDGNKMPVDSRKFPTYCTSFDNKYVVFDSYHSDYDTTLHAAKSLVVTSGEEVFLQEDGFVIPVPNALSETYLNMFLEEAMALVYQQPNPVISQKARRARIKLQQDNRAMGQGRGNRRYGRRGSSSRGKFID